MKPEEVPFARPMGGPQCCAERTSRGSEAAEAEHNAAGRRELNRIAEQIAKNLAEPKRVGFNSLRKWYQRSE